MEHINNQNLLHPPNNLPISKTLKARKINLSRSIGEHNLYNTLPNSQVVNVRLNNVRSPQLNSELDNMLNMINNEHSMSYKNYNEVKQYYNTNKGILLNSPDNVQFLRIGLIAAKGHYLQNNYEICLNILKTMIKNPQIPFSFKFVYQRQMLYLKVTYILAKNQIQFAYEEYKLNRGKCIKRELIRIDDVKIYDKDVNRLCQRLSKAFNRQGRVEIAAGNHPQGGQQREEKDDTVSVLQNLGSLESLLLRKKTFFAGIPIFLISKTYIQKLLNFIKKSKEQKQILTIGFAPPLNLQLLNHLYEFQPIAKQSHSYLDTLLFPVTYPVDYQIVDKNTWNMIEALFGKGFAIQRCCTCDNIISQQIEKDFSVKMSLYYKGINFVLQFQEGSLWQRSILPLFWDEMFELGQIKSTQWVNGSLREQIIGQGMIQRSQRIYSYIQFEKAMTENLNLSEKRLKKLALKYDLENYSGLSILGDSGEYTLNTVPIKHDINFALLTNRISQLLCLQQKIPIKLLNEWSSSIYGWLYIGLGVLSNVHELVYYYCLNQFILNLNINYKRSECQYNYSIKNQQYFQFSFAFAHIMKKIWFSHKSCNTINVQVFAQCFVQSQINKMRLFQNNYVADKINHDISIISPIYVIKTILLSLHNDVYTSTLPQPKNKRYQALIGQSVISNLFGIQISQNSVCYKCKEISDTKFFSETSLDIQILDEQEKVSLYFIYGSNQGSFGTNYQSGGKIHDGRGVKIVQQIEVCLGKNKKLPDLYLQIMKHFKARQGSSNAKLISLIMDENVNEWLQIDQAISLTDLENGQYSNKYQSISQINNQLKTSLIHTKQNANNGNLLCVYLMGQLKDKQDCCFVIFRNSQTMKNIGFPQLIGSLKLQSSSSIDNKNKELISSSIFNPKIQIQKYQLTKVKSHKNKLVHSALTIFTKSVSNQKNIECLFFNNGHSQQQILTLQQLVCKKFENEKGRNGKMSINLYYSKQQQQLRQQQTCKNCKTYSLSTLTTVQQFPQIFIINIINNTNKKNIIKFSLTNFDLHKIIGVNKKDSLLYNLKSAVFYNFTIPNGNTNQIKKGYVCVTLDSLDYKWYATNGNAKIEVNPADFYKEQVKILVYERVNNKRKQTFSDKSENK